MGRRLKTQTVLYRNLDNSDKTIDIQVRADKFAFGYKDRIIALYKLAPFMAWTSDIDTIQIDKSKWEKVDLYLNEMELSPLK